MIVSLDKSLSLSFKEYFSNNVVEAKVPGTTTTASGISPTQKGARDPMSPHPAVDKHKMLELGLYKQ